MVTAPASCFIGDFVLKGGVEALEALRGETDGLGLDGGHVESGERTAGRGRREY